MREESPPPQSNPPSKRLLSDSSPQSLDRRLSQRVSRKIEAGDIRGAIRLASGNDVLADFDETFSALQAKHPSNPIDSSIPLPPSSADPSIRISNDAVRAAIDSFPNGSAGGPDKLQPQHLKDMLPNS